MKYEIDKREKKHIDRIKIELNKLPRDSANRRVFTQRERTMVIDYVYLYGNQHLYRELGVHPQNVSKWKRLLKKNKQSKISKIKALKTNSSSGKGRIIGTALNTILKETGSKDILTQVTMVEALNEAGYSKNDLVEKIGAPSRDDFIQIMNAVKLLSKDYILTRKDI